MLKKVQNVWNFIIKKKKIATTTNLYSIKNNLLFTNAVSNSLIFYISDLKNIKIKKIKTLNSLFYFFNMFNIFFIIMSLLLISFILYLIFIF